MSQFVEIRHTFLNLDLIRMVIVEPENSKATIFWNTGDSQVYENQEAQIIIDVLKYLKMISIVIPNSMDTIA